MFLDTPDNNNARKQKNKSQGRHNNKEVVYMKCSFCSNDSIKVHAIENVLSSEELKRFEKVKKNSKVCVECRNDLLFSVVAMSEY